MNLARLIKGSQVDTVEGLPVLDKKKMEKWLRIEDKIKQGEDSSVSIGYIHEGLNQKKVIIKKSENQNRYEYLVGQRINEFIEKLPYFRRTYAIFLVPEEPNRDYCLYTLQEYVEGESLYRLLRNFNEKKYKLAIYQLLLILMSAQEKFDFCHNDLHDGNIIHQKLAEERELSFEISGKTYKLKADFQLILIDYARSHVRLDIKQLKIIPSMIVELPYERMITGGIPGCFDPLYDCISFMSEVGRRDKLFEFLIGFADENELSIQGDQIWNPYVNAKDAKEYERTLKRRLGVGVEFYPIDNNIYYYPAEVHPLSEIMFQKQLHSAIREYIDKIQTLNDDEDLDLIEKNTKEYCSLLTGYKQYLLDHRSDKSLGRVLEFFQDEYL